MQSFDLAHGVTQTLPTLRQPGDRTDGRFRVASKDGSIRETFMCGFGGRQRRAKGHDIVLWSFSAIRTTTKSKHCPQVAGTSLHPEKVWEKHRATRELRVILLPAVAPSGPLHRAN